MSNLVLSIGSRFARFGDVLFVLSPPSLLFPQIRYKGIKLSQYKNVYLKKHKLVPSTDQVRDLAP